MQRQLSALTDGSFDLVVIGGGVFGACAAWDAVQRGLSVALIERNDFCSATSAHSFKMIHGGIRYLQHMDLCRVRQSSSARRAMIRVAPHLARPLPIAVPTYGWGMKSKWIMRIAMGMYDATTFDRNRDITDPQRQIPGGCCLSRMDVMDRFPGLDTDGLSGAALFSDGQMYNPPRLVLAFVRSAAEAGAVVANYVEASGFIREGDRICGVTARDTLGDQTLEIRAKMVLNAAGPYADHLLARALGHGLKKPTYWSRDACFVVRRQVVGHGPALAVLTRTKDPDAMLSRGARHLFLVPWRGHTLVGVWHKVYHDDPDKITVTQEELEAYIDEINGAYVGLGLTLDEVTLWNAGLVAFGENERDVGDLRFGHRSRLVDHTTEHGLEGLFSLIGVRYTTGPCEAAAAVTRIFRRLGYKKPPPSRSHDTPIFGGDIDHFEALVQQVAAEAPGGLDDTSIRALAHNHGSAYDRVFALAREKPAWAQRIGDSAVLGAEVVHAVREEMAKTLADVVLRRTDLGTAAYPGRAAIESCARIMSGELRWSDAQTQQQIDRVIDSYPQAFRREPVVTG